MIANDLAHTYREDGYVTGLNLLEPHEIAEIQSQMSAWDREEGIPDHPGRQQNLHLKKEFLWRLATHPGLLDVMESIIGPDLLLLGTKLRCKMPNESQSRVFPWHQDSAYWSIDPSEAHSAWIAIDGNTEQNGPLMVIPQTHNGIIPHVEAVQNNMLRHKYKLPDYVIEEEKAIPVLLDSGSMAVFHSQLYHSSRPNLSNARRCTLLVRFVSPKIKSPDRYPAILVRGRDRFGHFKLMEPPFSTAS